MKKYRMYLWALIAGCAVAAIGLFHEQLALLISAGLGVLLCLLLQEYQHHIKQEREQERARATVAERERIARVLHDSFLQSVETLALLVEAVARRMPPDSRERPEMQQALDMAQWVMCEGRDQIHELRAEMSADDIDAALRQRVGMISSRRKLDVVIASSGQHAAAYAHVGREIYNIACEALANAVQHAQAQRITVTLEWGSDAMQLRVLDDGVGMDGARLVPLVPSVPSVPFCASGRWGLRGMRERAVLINGQLSIGSARPGGTEVHLRIAAPVPAISPVRQKAATGWPAHQAEQTAMR